MLHQLIMAELRQRSSVGECQAWHIDWLAYVDDWLENYCCPAPGHVEYRRWQSIHSCCETACEQVSFCYLCTWLMAHLRRVDDNDFGSNYWQSWLPGELDLVQDGVCLIVRAGKCAHTMMAQTQSGTGLKEQRLGCYLGLLKVGFKPLGYY